MDQRERKDKVTHGLIKNFVGFKSSTVDRLQWAQDCRALCTTTNSSRVRVGWALGNVLMFPFLDFVAHFIGQAITRFTIRAEIFGLAKAVANA